MDHGSGKPEKETESKQAKVSPRDDRIDDCPCPSWINGRSAHPTPAAGKRESTPRNQQFGSNPNLHFNALCSATATASQ